MQIAHLYSIESYLERIYRFGATKNYILYKFLIIVKGSCWIMSLTSHL